ncbi:hypothetical protein TraAM80_01000 [Trypanosoma rangeli]|uniref:Uncharacterized protein n=1 Tax=Trypanosoma rangeli TaxID=5698 RepID=A0A3R7RRJ4_TRYRA|nr:uncharacterized protein TraAM80_01000 [Trypanosoma rangeli]RNF11383.1 hypothetical protein TraAM80_01000 [Trypanosoma rangeli]|eukprot:RNF11383.1 hypothetical protein TraAM80_01000 [Trypanosoma rangeli]
MYAVSISLGSSSAVVAVAAATTTAASVAAGAETAAPIKVAINSAGHRSTPVMAAFAGNEEVLFGDDARALYPRTPDVVVPYLFASAAVAEQQRRQQRYDNDDAADKGNSGSTVEENFVLVLQRGIEEAAKKHYKGYCPLVTGEGDKAGRLGFFPPNQSDEGEENNDFVNAEDMLVEFFNHIKKHTVDAACELAATDEKSSPQGKLPQQAGISKIILTIVVPRYLFMGAVASSKILQGNVDDASQDVVQWVRNAVFTSHLGAVAAHVSVLFSDEAALLAMDAVACRPHPSHPMADRYFLLSASASMSYGVGTGGTITSPWPYSRVLIVDWGALGVSLTRLRLEGGCLVDEAKPLFLRACQTGVNSRGAEFGFAAAACSGGDAVNLALRERLATAFAQQQRRVLGYQSLDDFPLRAQRRLLLVAEDKKVALSKAAQVPVEVEALAEGIDMRDTATFSRIRVDAALRGEWKFVESFERVLAEYLHLLQQADDGVIDAVVLCGGMLQMPCIAQSLRHIFTQRALFPGEGPRLFARNLVIMEAATSTTLVEDCSSDSSKCSSQLRPNNTVFGAEELPCVGGCLHSYHLALAALQEQEHGYKDTARGGKNRKNTVNPGRKKQELAEGARRAWLALTLGDTGRHDDGSRRCNEVAVLQHPILLYTQSNLQALHSALTQQQKKGAALQISTAALSVLFAAHTLLPARVVVPLTGARRDPFVLYLFMGCEDDMQQQQHKEGGLDEMTALSCVIPLRNKGVSLPAVEEEEAGGKWRNCIVFTLCEDENSDAALTGGAATTEPLKLMIQLVRVATHASESFVIGPGDVQASVTLDLRER